MTPPVPKTQKPTSAPAPADAAPAPEAPLPPSPPAVSRLDPSCCSYLTYAFLIFSIAVSAFANYTWFMSHDCSKAEEVLQKICDPELERIRLITETTIPDFNMSPIAMDVAKKCDDIQECLSPVKCARLRSQYPLPARCPIFYFFNIRFAQCREQVLLAPAKNEKCLRTFFGPGPLQCHVLNEHYDCVYRVVQKVCGGAGLEEEFVNYVEEYRKIIECPPKVGEELEVAPKQEEPEEVEDVPEAIEAKAPGS